MHRNVYQQVVFMPPKKDLEMSLTDYLKCPGPDRTLEAVPEIHSCPECGNEIEIWTDEKKRRCSQCGTVLKNSRLQSDGGTANASGLPADNTDRDFKELVQLAFRLGASNACIISSSDVSVEDDLAQLCREPRCENYGLSPSCPPHVAGPPGFRELQSHSKQAVVVKIDVPTAILFSDERRGVMQLLHEIAAGVEQAAVKLGYSRSKAFAGGSCKKIFCGDYTTCRVVSEGGECRNPEHARPSMSGFGINVSKLMQAAGWPAKMATQQTDAGAEPMTWVAGLVLIG